MNIQNNHREWKQIHDQYEGNGLKVLNELFYRQEMAKHPYLANYPESYFAYKKKTFKDNGANELTKSIIKYLQLRGYQAERISSSGRVVNNVRHIRTESGFMQRIGSVKYIPGTSTNGTADISATIEGMSTKIEVKYGKDRQSEAQKEYEKAVKTAGGLYYIARDFQTTYEWINKLIDYMVERNRDLFTGVGL